MTLDEGPGPVCIVRGKKRDRTGEEEEEEGPRAPAMKPGRVT